MSWHARLRNVFQTNRLSDDLDNELAFHVAETVDHLVEEGLSREQAEQQARRRFGNYSIQKEKTREMDLLGWLETTMSDISYALRQLKLNPGFAAVAILSLALGIGANTAIFQLLDAIRLRGLPVRNPSELVAIERGNPKDFFIAGKYFSREQAFTYAQIEALEKHQQAFSEVMTFSPTRFNLSSSGRSRYAEGLLVSTNYLRMLGVAPILGSGFAQEDDKVACSNGAAVLNYNFWQAEFGGDPGVVGKNISLDGHQFPISGITPPSFFGVEPGYRFDVAVPLCVENVLAKDGKGPALDRMSFWLTPIARLKPGWTVERAAKHINELSHSIFAETVPSEYRPDFAASYVKNKLTVASASAGVSSLRERCLNPLWILMAITGSVLLIACANLGNLLLARATAREREIAIRQAIGASRVRLFSQLLTESLLLATAGASLGIGLAQALSRALVAFLNIDGNPIVLPTGLNWHVFGFLSLLAIVTCVLFGLVPALRASGGAPATAMRGGRTTTTSRESNGLRRVLVVAQVALSLILLVAALLFTRSLRKLLSTDVGFDAHNVIVVNVGTKDSDAWNDERKRLLAREVEDQIRSAPGLTSVASVALTPFSGSGWNMPIHPDDDHSPKSKNAWFNRVGSGYFTTLGTPLLAGRDFNSHDDLNAPKVAIVNAAFAKHLFAGKNPVGRSFRVEGDTSKADEVYQIVGMVRTTKYNDVRDADFDIAFLPATQDPQPSSNFSFVVRGQASPAELESIIQRQIAKVDASLLVDYHVLAVQVKNSVLLDRLMASLSLAFGILAACLSTLGLYGVMSYMVVRRRNEIGVRFALGASRGDVYRLLAKDASLMVAAGLVVGLGTSLFLSRFAESMLFELKASDPLSLVLAAVLLAFTAVFATLIPSRRAARLEPTMVLREE